MQMFMCLCRLDDQLKLNHISMRLVSTRSNSAHPGTPSQVCRSQCSPSQTDAWIFLLQKEAFTFLPPRSENKIIQVLMLRSTQIYVSFGFSNFQTLHLLKSRFRSNARLVPLLRRTRARARHCKRCSFAPIPDAPLRSASEVEIEKAPAPPTISLRACAQLARSMTPCTLR